MPLPGGRSFNEMVEHVKLTQNVDDESAKKIVGSIEHKIKKGRLQIKLMQLSAGRFDPKKPNEYGDTEEQARARELITAVQKNRKLQPLMNSPEGRKANRAYVDYGIKINPKEHLKKMRMQGAQLKKNYHLVSWYDTPLTKYASMKLVEENGKYAKYWLLNAKDVNGNDWGVVPSSIERNITSFINRPFVITAKTWIPDSIYGDVFDHPHIPTNDMNLILKHQEHFRVANIIDVHERDGEWFAILERDPKYAHLTLPAFCSPAIYQLDALEHESALSKWTGLHLAGLDENPAYGARIAILRGTCAGPKGQCIHQLKEAKLTIANSGHRSTHSDFYKNLEYKDMIERNSADNEIVDEEEMEDEEIKRKILKGKLGLLKMAIRTTFPKLADVNINPKHGRTIADAYDQMKHDPENPEVKSAYGALIKETSQQYEDLIKGGLKIDKVTDESNAYRNSAEMHRDVLEKNHLNYFPTEAGFGPEGKNKDHPMLQQTKYKDPEGKPMLANDMFRIVHDINGHVRGEPSGFGPRGEQQAYLTHKQMFSSTANKALFTETAGQNNWVNFNKKSGESNRKNPRNTEYAEQKAGLLSPNIIYGKWHI